MIKTITTDNLSDIVNIFDPKAQELDDAGGARILYVFEDSEPIRVRVGELFKLKIREPQIELKVDLPVVGPVQDGTISLLSPESLNVSDDIKEKAYQRYQLNKEGIQDFIFMLQEAIGFEDIDVILGLLEEQK